MVGGRLRIGWLNRLASRLKEVREGGRLSMEELNSPRSESRREVGRDSIGPSGWMVRCVREGKGRVERGCLKWFPTPKKIRWVRAGKEIESKN